MAGALKRLISLDWDAVAGILAAVVALVLHLLHWVEPEVVLAIILVILALLLLRDLRREREDDRVLDLVRELRPAVQRIENALRPPDTVLVGPGSLRSASEQFAAQARGEMTYFNVCLSMFKPRPLFDKLVGAALENPRVTRIQFILDESEREAWATVMVPKAASSPGASKLAEPRWLKLDKTISFIIAEQQDAGRTEALLSFWGEPFMSQASGRDVPRYVFHVMPHSELIVRLSELERDARMRSSA